MPSKRPETTAGISVPALAQQVTIQRAAELLDASVPTIRRWIARGDLPAYRYGPRIVRIDLSDLRAMREPVTPLAELRGGDAQ